MKRVLLPLVICFYVALGSLILSLVSTAGASSLDDAHLAGLIVAIVFSVLALLLLVANLVVSALQNRNTDIANYKQRAKAIMWFKIAMIPFFIANFVLWAVFTLAGVVPFLMFLIVIAPVIGATCAFLAMLGTSLHAIGLVSRLYVDGVLTKAQCVLHIVFQVIFLLDVISSVVLTVQLSKKVKQCKALTQVELRANELTQ